MKELEELLVEAHKKGELVHLSLIASGGSYRATYATASSAGGYVHTSDTDPVGALVQVLRMRPKKRNVAPERATEGEPEADGEAEVKPERTGKLSNYM